MEYCTIIQINCTRWAGTWVSRQPTTHQTKVTVTVKPTNKPTAKKKAFLVKLTYTSSRMYMKCGSGLMEVAHALWNLLIWVLNITRMFTGIQQQTFCYSEVCSDFTILKENV